MLDWSFSWNTKKTDCPTEGHAPRWGTKRKLQKNFQTSGYTSEAAAASFAGGLTASAIHTFAIGQKLAHESGFFDIDPIVGLAIENLQILQPVMAGDHLRGRVTITAMRPSRSRPEQGIIENLTEVLNQDGDVVLQYALTELVRRRPATQ